MRRCILLAAIALMAAVLHDTPADTAFGLPLGVGDPPVSDATISIVLPPGVDPANPVVSIGELVVFLTEVVGGAGTLALEWDFGDGTIIMNGFLIDHTYTLGGTYEVSVFVTDTLIMDGVPTVVGTASDSLTLTVEGVPVPTQVTTWGQIKALFAD